MPRRWYSRFLGQKQPPVEPSQILPDKPPPPPPPRAPTIDPDVTQEDLPAFPDRPTAPPHAPSRRGRPLDRPTPPEGTPIVIDAAPVSVWSGSGLASAGYLGCDLIR